MVRFVTFVDASNHASSPVVTEETAAALEGRYAQIFRQAVDTWKACLSDPESAINAVHLRVYLYEIGAVDEFEVNSTVFRNLQKNLFTQNKKLIEEFSRKAAESEPAIAKTQIPERAFTLCFQEAKTAYLAKKEKVEELRRRRIALARDTRFLQFRAIGYWKIHFLSKLSEEKQMDTSIAVDLVTLAPTFDVALLVSGDSDMVPAVNYLKSIGKQVGVVAFANPSNNLKPGALSLHLAGAADFIVRVDEQTLLKPSKKPNT